MGERREYPIRKNLEMMNEEENGTMRKHILRERLHVPKAGCSYEDKFKLRKWI